jgi:hypothetical protein
LDIGMTRAPAAPVDDRIDLFLLPFKYGFNRSIRTVFHPTKNPMPISRTLGFHPVKNPLDPAPDDNMHSCFFSHATPHLLINRGKNWGPRLKVRLA